MSAGRQLLSEIHLGSRLDGKLADSQVLNRQFRTALQRHSLSSIQGHIMEWSLNLSSRVRQQEEKLGRRLKTHM